MKKLLLLAMLCGVSLVATAEGLRLSAGVGNRNFRQAEFSHAAVPTLSGVLNVDKTSIGSLEDFQNSLPNGGVGFNNININTVTFTGGSASTHDGYSAAESTGLTFGAAYGLYSNERLSVDLVGNLSYYHIDAADRGAFAGQERTDTTIVHNGVQSGVIHSEASNYMAGLSHATFDLQLWTIDLGLSASYAFDNNISVYLAAGPTLSLADMESSSYARAYAKDTPTFAGKSGGHDNENEFEWGLYVSAGASYMVTENLGVALELRYDEAFGTVGTKYVKQDLDSWGGVLKVIYEF